MAERPTCRAPNCQLTVDSSVEKVGIVTTELMRPWIWRVVPTAAELEEAPPEISPEECQNWCNFVVWYPSELPSDCIEVTGTLRKEAPPGRTGSTNGRTPWSNANTAAYRLEIKGLGRRLRIKQFLYDWAFPAADHPCLWGSRTRPIPFGRGNVLWLGIDYLGNVAGSARLSRTTVELSVLEGEFSDAEMTSIYAGLRRVSSDVSDRIINTPFHELSYWARYPVDMVSVPTGLFRFQRRDKKHEGDWIPGDELTDFLNAGCIPTALDTFGAESAAVFISPTGAQELEVVYNSPQNDGAELRLVLQPAGKGRIEYPPQREKHPAEDETVEVQGIDVHLAYVDPVFGPFDAQWRDAAADIDGKLLSSVRVGMNRARFLSVLETLLDRASLIGGDGALWR